MALAAEEVDNRIANEAVFDCVRADQLNFQVVGAMCSLIGVQLTR
jgi:hypothetical protein